MLLQFSIDLSEATLMTHWSSINPLACCSTLAREEENSGRGEPARKPLVPTELVGATARDQMDWIDPVGGP